MKSPQVVRSRIASGNGATKSPSVKSRHNKHNKENMGLSTINSKITKVRPVPDFGKLHKKWESQLNMNKAQAKKPLTMVQEFGFCKPGSRKDQVPLKELHSKHNMEHKPSKKAQFTRETEIRMVKKEVLKSQDMNAQVVDIKKATVKSLSQIDLPDCDRDSFGTMALKQQDFGLEFTEDRDALKSILDSTGVSETSLKTDHKILAVSSAAQGEGNSINVRQTVDGTGFKQPLCPNMRQTQQALRRSIYYNGPKPDEMSKQFIYSEFARRMASRLTLDNNTPNKRLIDQRKTAHSYVLSSPAPKVIQPRNSIYVKVDYSQQLANQVSNVSPSKEIRAPMSEKKAQRVLSKKPTQSPAVRLSKSTCKKKPSLSMWKHLLGPVSPQVKVKLFQDDESDENEPLAQQIDEEAVRLKEIEEVEKKLQKEIDEMENEKRENPALISPDSPAFNRPVPATPTSTKKSTSVAQPSQPSPKPKRMALGELNQSEIAVRSSPSYRERGRARNKHKSAPHFASCVFDAEQKTPTKRVHFGRDGMNVLRHPESPSARYHKKCVSSSGGSMEIESPKFRASALRKASRYSPIGGGRSPKARDYSPTSRLQDSQSSQVYNMMVELDKENSSPLRLPMSNMSKGKKVITTPSKKTTIREEETEFIVEYDDEEQSIHNMSVEDLNLTISESEAAMQGLQKQEQSLMEQSHILEQSNLDETNNITIMEQMALIQKKQQELMNLQTALQEKLEKRKSKKPHGNEKRQLVFSSSNNVEASKNKPTSLREMQQENSLLRNKHSGSTVKKSSISDSRNVVDVSPIGLGSKEDDYSLNSGFGGSGSRNIFLTPEEQVMSPSKRVKNIDDYDYENSPTIFPVSSNNNRSNDTSRQHQPLHSTAHESQYLTHHPQLDKSDMLMSPLVEETIEENSSNLNAGNAENSNGGGVLSRGLLQMAQTWNATPHKSKHWKKQYLDTDVSKEEECRGGNLLEEDSFYSNGESVKTTPLSLSLLQRTPLSAARSCHRNPIGTPRSPGLNFAAMTIHTPNRRGGVGTCDLMATPMGYSPKSSLFSGSAQLLMNSPIQTPLALREAIGGSIEKKKETTPTLEEISIDGTPENTCDVLNDSLTEICMKSQKYASPPRVKQTHKSPKFAGETAGSLSLAANLKKSPIAFSAVKPRRLQQTPACSTELQQTLFSKVKIKYMDALLDEEVSLYSSRLQCKNGVGFKVRCQNPLQKILMEGDDYHFVPIIEPSISPPRLLPSVGSAFTASSAFRQIRV